MDFKEACLWMKTLGCEPEGLTEETWNQLNEQQRWLVMDNCRLVRDYEESGSTLLDHYEIT